MKPEPDRRQRLLQLAAGAAFLTLAVVLVLIVVCSSGSGNGGDTKIEGISEVNELLAGMQQERMVLGDPEAPVELVEFGDLQCSSCKHYAEEILPPLIESKIRHGKAKLDFRNFTIIDERSLPAGAAALAAGKQRRGWYYVELFYRNQREEHSGYVNDEFLEAIAKAAGVRDLVKWNQDRKGLLAKVESTSEEARGLGFTGTPSFAVQGPKTDGLEPLGTPESAGALEEAIEKAG